VHRHCDCSTIIAMNGGPRHLEAAVTQPVAVEAAAAAGAASGAEAALVVSTASAVPVGSEEVPKGQDDSYLAMCIAVRGKPGVEALYDIGDAASGCWPAGM
jgi:hypothetical protein